MSETQGGRLEIPEHEYSIEGISSSGPGGQRANRKKTGARLLWNIRSSGVLDLDEQKRVEKWFKTYKPSTINNESVVSLESDEFASGIRNKEAVVERLQELITQALVILGKRIPTKPTRASKEKRLHEKKARSEIKKLRQKPSVDD